MQIRQGKEINIIKIRREETILLFANGLTQNLREYIYFKAGLFIRVADYKNSNQKMKQKITIQNSRKTLSI